MIELHLDGDSHCHTTTVETQLVQHSTLIPNLILQPSFVLFGVSPHSYIDVSQNHPHALQLQFLPLGPMNA